MSARVLRGEKGLIAGTTTLSGAVSTARRQLDPEVRSRGEELDADELAAWRGMLRVHADMTRELDADLTLRHGLPLTSYEVLLYLADAPGGRRRMSELADSVLLSRSGLTRLVDRLERDGLLEREQCEEDARGYFAAITDKGRAVFTEARRTHLAGVRERFIDRLSREELRTLGALWGKIRRGR
ncbi:MAG: MarR family transcriptional regulator [Thermoleophilaceae bacterium]|nr:MarR family transcriptional regulator [Thermoleophilaceae bacterium]